jgi:hypothetical protein
MREAHDEFVRRGVQVDPFIGKHLAQRRVPLEAGALVVGGLLAPCRHVVGARKRPPRTREAGEVRRRGPVAESRLRRLDDGRYEYRPRRTAVARPFALRGCMPGLVALLR